LKSSMRTRFCANRASFFAFDIISDVFMNCVFAGPARHKPGGFVCALRIHPVAFLRCKQQKMRARQEARSISGLIGNSPMGE
jgi:hypothetical protein